MPKTRPLAIIAEDDIIQRMEAADTLTDLGYEVREASHAAEAMAHLEAARGAALLYTDIRLPGIMDGIDLAHICADRWPATQIIVCTACDHDLAADMPSGARFIPKPCLEAQIRTALAALESQRVGKP